MPSSSQPNDAGFRAQLPSAHAVVAATRGRTMGALPAPASLIRRSLAATRVRVEL